MRPSSEQQRARERNWIIFRLRGAYVQLRTIPNTGRILQEIDNLLISMDAEPHFQRLERERRKINEELDAG